MPIEIFHFPEEMQDGGLRRQLEELGAKIKEVRDLHPLLSFVFPSGLLTIQPGAGSWQT